MTRCAVSLIFILLFSIPAFPAENGKEQPSALPKEHRQKLKQIADFVAGELTRKGIMTVEVQDFTDFKGNPSAKGSDMAKELKKHLLSLSNMNLMVVGSGAEALVGGVLIPFKDSGKWKLDIKVVLSNKGEIITSYTGIFKKPKTVKIKK